MILGREVEQAQIEQFLSTIHAGGGGTLLLIGEPGIGKTTLLDWTADAAGGRIVVRAAGRESEADIPFVAIADLLRPLRNRIAHLPRAQAQALRSAFTLTGSTNQGSVNSAVLDLLDAAAREHPLLLLVDDYHWLDSASQGVISFVSRRAESVGVGLVLTTRGPAPADHRGVELRLEPLTPDVAAAVVRGRGNATTKAVQTIVALASGNPLALVELPLTEDAQHLQAGTSVDIDQPVSVSPAVERAYRARLDDLPEDSRRAMLYVAEASSDSLTTIIRALAAVGLDGGSIEPAVAADFLIVDGSTILFRHPLMRSVVHQSASPHDVRLAHRALADATPDEDRRAWHLAAAATEPDDDVAAALDEAARRASARGAAAAAAAALRRAATLSTSIPEGIRRLTAAAKAAHRAGDMVLTARLIDEVRALCGDTGPDATMLLLDADIRMRSGDVAGAYGALRLDAGLIAEHDPHSAVAMLLLASKLRVFRFEATEATREVDDALVLLREHEHDLVHLVAVGMTRTMTGDLGARDAVLRAMHTAIATPHGHTHTLGIGWPLVWLEEYEQARAFISRSVQIQREGGHRAYLPQALLPLAELDLRTGRWDRALINASEALRLFDEEQQPTEAAVASALLARLEAASGADDVARRHAAAAVGSDIRFGLRTATAFAEAALGLLDLGRGHLLEAVEHLKQARAVAVRGGIGEPNLLPVDADLAEALIRTGDRASADEVLFELIRRGEALGRPSAIASGLRCRGLAAEEDGFRSFFDEALAILEQIPTPFDMARTELCYGERLRRAHDRVEGRSRLRRALAVFENLGAEPWIARAQAELNASGETLRKPSPVATLTPQERQVAAVVASGATNREAAAALFISPKTVEFHLGTIYRKLGVRSRTELANVLNIPDVPNEVAAGRPDRTPSG